MLERAGATLLHAAPALVCAVVADGVAYALARSAGLPARTADLAAFAIYALTAGGLLRRRLPPLGGARFVALMLLALPLRSAGLAWGLGAPLPEILGLSCGGAIAGAWWVAAWSAWAQPPSHDRFDALAVVAIVYVALLRSVYLGLPELLPDEAYHWTWATHLDLSYLDHPPLTGWAIWLSTALLGKSELAVRVFAWGAGGATVGFLYAFGRQLYGPGVGLATALLGACLPFYFAVGIAIMPDSLLLACWAAGLYFASRALLGGHGRAWLALGGCLGLGFLAKYTIGLLGLGVVLFTLLDRPSRVWLRRPEPYLGAAFAFLLLSPVILWNAQHDWASFAFQTTRRLHRHLELRTPWLLVHGALLLSPVVFAAALWALWPGRRHALIGARDEGERRARRLQWTLTGVALAPFLLYSLALYPRAHWTAPAWLAILPGVARALRPGLAGAPTGGARRLLRRSLAPSLGLLLLFYGLGLQHVVLGLPGVPYGRLFDRYFWKEAVPVVERELARLGRTTGETPVLGSNTKWSIAASLSFYGPPEWQSVILSRHLFGEQASMWSFWNPVDPAIGRPLLLLGRDVEDLTEPHVISTLEEAGPVEIATLARDGVPLRRLYFRTAGRYTGPPPHRVRNAGGEPVR